MQWCFSTIYFSFCVICFCLYIPITRASLISTLLDLDVLVTLGNSSFCRTKINWFFKIRIKKKLPLEISDPLGCNPDNTLSPCRAGCPTKSVISLTRYKGTLESKPYFKCYVVVHANFFWNYDVFQMTSSDKDFRFMAANDLMSELQKVKSNESLYFAYFRILQEEGKTTWLYFKQFSNFLYVHHD